MLSIDENIIDHRISHFVFVSISYIFFACLWNFLLRNQIGYNLLIKPSVKNYWKLVDNTVALVYVIVAVMWVVAWIMSGDVWKDPFLTYNTRDACFIAVSLGRFLHHLILYLLNGVEELSFHIHHVMFSISLTFVLLTKAGQGILMQAFLMEIGNIPLCIRPMLILTGRSKGSLYEVNKYTLLTTMTLSRIVSISFLAHSFYHYSQSLSYIPWLMYIIGLAFITPYSAYILVKLFQKDFMTKY